MQQNARRRWWQNRCGKQLKHGASGDDIGKQTSKHEVSRTVSMHTIEFTLRQMLPDCQIVATIEV
jgi:hypothetical protein